MSPFRLRSGRWLVVAGLAFLVLTQSGCAGFLAQMLYVIKGGDKIEPDYPGLEGKTVAIVCVANGSSTGPSSVSSLLERMVGMLLTQKGKKIKVVPPSDVANWIDNNDWNQLDYREIGRGIKADMVLAIDLDNLSLHQGSTLYKGRADVTLTVYDMSSEGKVVFRRSLPEFSFPKDSARPITDMSEAKFRVLFIEVLAQHVARYFCPYPIQEGFAGDAVLIGM